MRQIITLSLVLMSLSVQAQTQGEMNEQAAESYQKADKELNAVYQQINKTYAEDTIFIGNLKNSQRLWIKFRDAEMEMKYPDHKNRWYGSVFPMCWSMDLTDLTIHRTKRLRQWLDGIDKDACRGSLPEK